MPPDWLEALAWASLVTAVASSIAIVVDIRIGGYRQPMGVMEWVWPITALYLGVLGLALYWRVGRRRTARYIDEHGAEELPHWVRVGISSTHCGGGCTLGDIIAESVIFAFGITLFGASIWASFALDFTLALVLGVLFQLAAIRSMMDLPLGRALAQAAKADVWSLTAFEVGLFGWMALMWWVLFPDPHLEPNTASFWFLMQIGMAIGLCTSYPMNAALVRRGIKEAM